MTRTLFAPSDGATPQLALVTPHRSESEDPAGLHRLPSEWETVDAVRVGTLVIDHVVVGPNGVFTVILDPDPTPVVATEEGLYRNGTRITTLVKQAAMTPFALRSASGGRIFAYPMLVASIEGGRACLDRLGVIPGNGIPEAIWSHPGMSLSRTSRVETVWSLRSLSG